MRGPGYGAWCRLAMITCAVAATPSAMMSRINVTRVQRRIGR